MAVADEALEKVLHDLHGRAGLSSAVVVSTCMRTEVYAEAERFHAGVADVRNALSVLSGALPEDFGDHLYAYYDEGAVTHLFEVAAGLDSAVVGEGEILGQVRRAWAAAAEAGTAGPVLSELFRHAVEVGKRARTETAIGKGPVSISQAAVAMARSHLGGLAGRSVLVVGAGDMGEGMARVLAEEGAAPVLVANRTPARAEALARRIGGSVIPLADVAQALARVDVALTSTGAPGVVITAELAAEPVAARSGRPLLVVDMAVPRDVDPALAHLPGVTVLDMDDLRDFAEIGVASRRAEIDRVRVIVAEEADRHASRASARIAAPLVSALRDRAEELRRAELERQRGRLAGLGDEHREAVESITRAVVAKLLHEPTVRLKEAAGTSSGERLAEAARTLFDL